MIIMIDILIVFTYYHGKGRYFIILKVNIIKGLKGASQGNFIDNVCIKNLIFIVPPSKYSK